MPRSRSSALALLTVLSLTGCASAPTEQSYDLPAPEPKGIDEPSVEPAPPASEQSDETLVPANQPETAAPPDTPKKRALKVSIGAQQFTYAEDGTPVRSGPISSGAQGYPTPTGHFSVLGKDKDKVSSRYTNQLGMDAWMPYAIQFHGHYFLHEGWLPGYPDSHGCIRVGEKDARFLFERMRVGDPVVVTRK
jgi:lipoprotein-anchoring transpeptidase ErfK/SrfK